MKKILITHIILVLIALSSSDIYSQIKINRTINVEDGLAQSTVFSIFQDSQGYLWIGTNGGLSKWDGINFKNYYKYDGIADARINAICEDKEGIIYIGTHEGLTIFKDNKFETLYPTDEFIDNRISDIYCAKDGTIYIGTFSGLYLFDYGRFEQPFHPDLLGKLIISINEGNDGKIYVGTFRNGLLIKDHDKVKQITNKDGLLCNAIRGVIENDDGSLFVASEYGLNKIKDGKITTLFDIHNYNSEIVTVFTMGADGTIYCGTNGSGILQYKNGKVDFINDDNGLSHNYIFSLFKGKDETIYFGTHGGGVNIYRSDQFVTYNESSGLTDNIVMSIAQDKDGKIYFGTMNRGACFLDDGKIYNNKRVKGNRIINIYNGDKGEVYFCSTTRGISILRNGSFEYLDIDDGLPSNLVTGVMEIDNDAVLISTSLGVVEFRNNEISSNSVPEEIKNSYINSMFKTQSDDLLFGAMRDGLFWVSGDTVRHFTTEDGLIDNSIFSVFESSDGAVYIGTENGLSIYSKGSFTSLDVKNGLSDNTIYAIAEDNYGRIYIATNKGVNVLDKSSGSLQIRVFSQVDGMASDECNSRALIKDDMGRIWIGTIKGVTCYDPSKDMPHSIPPKVHITRVRLYEDDLAPNIISANSAFKYDENYFKFDFIGINVSAPQKVTYKYKLNGVDDDWIETHQRFVQYTNLNDGEYQFEVKAMNEWGYWSEAKTVSFSILPPFWETWYFIFIMFIIFGGGISLIVVYRVRQLLAIERLRTKIAADLHDNIGSSLTEIAVTGELLSQNLVGTNDSLRKGITTITETSRELVDKMSDIVWLVNPKRDSLYDLILRLKDSYTELLSYKGISFKSDNLKSLANVSLKMEQRQNLYLIFKEGINNCIKHSSCDEILLNANVVGKRLEVMLKDNGAGFNHNKNISGNGLSNMNDRAKSLGGELNIISTIGEGTKIEFIGTIY